ncbi:MAG: hypothetical protein KKA19_03075, partial [Candidatus Margulisbacteria bacterium]|nr:hypothetical protein [Candidatus Margulisiibacteriota bacterium]
MLKKIISLLATAEAMPAEQRLPALIKQFIRENIQHNFSDCYNYLSTQGLELPSINDEDSIRPIKYFYEKEGILHYLVQKVNSIHEKRKSILTIEDFQKIFDKYADRNIHKHLEHPDKLHEIIAALYNEAKIIIIHHNNYELIIPASKKTEAEAILASVLDRDFNYLFGLTLDRPGIKDNVEKSFFVENSKDQKKVNKDELISNLKTWQEGTAFIINNLYAEIKDDLISEKPSNKSNKYGWAEETYQIWIKTIDFLHSIVKAYQDFDKIYKAVKQKQTQQNKVVQQQAALRMEIEQAIRSAPEGKTYAELLNLPLKHPENILGEKNIEEVIAEYYKYYVPSDDKDLVLFFLEKPDLLVFGRDKKELLFLDKRYILSTYDYVQLREDQENKIHPIFLYKAVFKKILYV